MTKTEARQFLRRAADGIKDARAALAKDDPEAMAEALQDASGSLGTIESALHPHYGDGVGGLKLNADAVGY